MTSDPTDELVRAALAEQTLALAADAAALSVDDVAAPCALPGWTRGHLLAHVRLNAEAFVGVLGAAARGEVASMYPGRAERDAAIEAAAGDSQAAHVEALLRSADAFARAWSALPRERYVVEFTAPAGWFRPAADIAFFRWREAVLHHCDLHPVDAHDASAAGAAGGAAARNAVDLLTDAEPALVARMLAETCEGFAARDDVPPLVVTATDVVITDTAGTPRPPRSVTWVVHESAAAATDVQGTAAALAAWLTGRSAGAGLTSSGPLPALPPFA